MIKKIGATICTIAIAFAAGMVFQHQTEVQAQGQKVYELRTYTTLPGRLPALLNRFGGGEIDLFIKHGMTSVGYWVPVGWLLKARAGFLQLIGISLLVPVSGIVA